MFLVVAKKSRTFSSFPCSANEQVYKSWEGAQPGSQPELASGNIPCHRHAQFTNGGWLEGRNSLFSVSLNFFCEFNESSELWKACGFHDCCLGTGYAIAYQVVRKTVFCIACFAYLLLLML